MKIRLTGPSDQKFETWVGFVVLAIVLGLLSASYSAYRFGLARADTPPVRTEIHEGVWRTVDDSLGVVCYGAGAPGSTAVAISCISFADLGAR